MTDVDVDPERNELSRWLADETLRLCQIPSVTGDEAALCDDLEARLGRLAAAGQPLTIRRLGNTLLVQRLRRPGRPLEVEDHVGALFLDAERRDLGEAGGLDQAHVGPEGALPAPAHDRRHRRGPGSYVAVAMAGSPR